MTGNQCWTYATEKSQINLEHSNYLTLNTWLGYERFLQFFPKENLLPFYFELDDGIRLKRGLDREIQTGNRKFEELCRRFLSDQIDFKEEYLKLYNPIMINNNGTIEETMDQIDNALKRELNLFPKEKFR